jgi:2-polyprenyl-6-methoxyphenol hydroxylase-like FAD-dependent oxidoreductase
MGREILSMAIQSDVVIVGAGIAGLALGIMLAKKGSSTLG